MTHRHNAMAGGWRMKTSWYLWGLTHQLGELLTFRRPGSVPDITCTNIAADIACFILRCALAMHSGLCWRKWLAEYQLFTASCQQHRLTNVIRSCMPYLLEWNSAKSSVQARNQGRKNISVSYMSLRSFRGISNRFVQRGWARRFGENEETIAHHIFENKVGDWSIYGMNA